MPAIVCATPLPGTKKTSSTRNRSRLSKRPLTPPNSSWLLLKSRRVGRVFQPRTEQATSPRNCLRPVPSQAGGFLSEVQFPLGRFLVAMLVHSVTFEGRECWLRLELGSHNTNLSYSGRENEKARLRPSRAHPACRMLFGTRKKDSGRKTKTEASRTADRPRRVL